MLTPLSTKYTFKFNFSSIGAEVEVSNTEGQTKLWTFSGSKNEAGLKNFFFSLTDDQCKSWFPKIV